MSNVSDPAAFASAIVPADGTNLSSPTRGIYVGVTGNLTVRMFRGQNTITFLNVPVGILPIQVDRVLATGTTATQLIALL